MSVSQVKYKADKLSKEKTKKIGRRSIYDILNDRPVKLTFDEKVNYIRHRFTYYEGNYDLFNDEKGKPTKRKELLNRIITEVVLKNREPSILKRMNKKILLWRKDKLEKANKIRTLDEIKQLKDYTKHDWFIKTIHSCQPKFDYWKEKIIEFINSPENNLDPYLMKHITYKRLKDLTSKWLHQENKDIDYNKELLRKYPIEVLIYREMEVDV